MNNTSMISVIYLSIIVNVKDGTNENVHTHTHKTQQLNVTDRGKIYICMYLWDQSRKEWEEQ